MSFVIAAQRETLCPLHHPYVHDLEQFTQSNPSQSTQSFAMDPEKGGVTNTAGDAERETHIHTTPTDLPILSASVSHTEVPIHHQRHNAEKGSTGKGFNESDEPRTSEESDASTAVTRTPTTATTEVTFPEGGREAWLVVLGSFLSMVSSFGIMNTLGVIQAHLVQDQLKGQDEGKIGWIFGVYSFLCFFGGIIIGPLFDSHGPRWLLLSGTVCLVSGLVAFAFCQGMCCCCCCCISPCVHQY